MKTSLTLDFEIQDRLIFSCAEDPNKILFEDSRDYSTDDVKKIESLISDYRSAIDDLSSTAKQKKLLKIGQEFFDWLNGSASWMLKALDKCDGPPLILEITVSQHPSKNQNELTFIEAPWELLADKDGFLAANKFVQFSPLRRLGKHNEPSPPSNYRPSTIFMAADPSGATSLSYEAEENAIIKNTGAIGMDLIVEETGNIDSLVDCIGFQDAVDILHISCHGNNEPSPALSLESEEGSGERVTPDKFSKKIANKKPRLVFISACLTSSPDKLFNSFSTTLLEYGYPAVIGWGGSVGDNEAARFATLLYDRIAHHDSIEDAVASARFNLLSPDDETPHPKNSEDWHLARLYLKSNGGGVISKGNEARQSADIDAGYKAILQAKDDTIPVAGREEFVGRRRQMMPCRIFLASIWMWNKLQAKNRQRKNRHPIPAVRSKL